MMMSLFENLERACEMTVLPQPKAPGIAVVPPCTQLEGILALKADTSKWVLREQGIEDTLASEEGVVGCVLLRDGTGCTDGPYLHHCVLGDLAVKLGL